MSFWSGVKKFLVGEPKDVEVEEVGWLPEGKIGAYEEGKIYLKEGLPEEKKQKVLEHEWGHLEWQEVHPHSSAEDLAMEEVAVTLGTGGKLVGRKAGSIIHSIMDQFGMDYEDAEDAFYEGALRVLDEDEAYNLAQYLGRG